MASLENTVSIIFEGVDRMGAGIDSATRRIDSLTGSVERMATPLATVTKGLLVAEGAAIALGVAYATKAYQASVAFESAQKDLAKTLDDADGPVEQFTRRVTELSNTYGESATNILQAMANYRQAGFTAQESSQLVKNGLDLVIAGDVEAAQASEYLVAILKGFRAPASEAGNIMEVLNATSNTYATSVGELAKGMAGISPIAKAMGLDFIETSEVLTPIIEVFRSGDEAATALKTGLLKLLDDSKPVQEALASIGVSQRDSNGALREGKDILADVAAEFGSLDESQKLAFSSQLFGIDQSARMVTVMESLANNTADVNKALANSTTVAEEVAIKLNSAEGAGKRMSATYENLARTLGTQFRDQFAGIVSGMAEVFEVMEAEADGGAFDALFDSINPKLAEIERLAREVAAALPDALANADYSGFTEGLDALLGNLDELSIDASDLQAVIEGLGETFNTLSNFTAGVGEVVAGVMAVVRPLVEAFLDMDADTQRLIGTVGALSSAAVIVAPAISGITAAISGLAGSGGVIPGVVTALGRLLPLLAGPAGLAIAAATAGPAVADLAASMLGFDTRAERMAKAQDGLAEATAGLNRQVSTWGELNELIESGAVTWDYASGRYVDASDAVVTATDHINRVMEENQAQLDVVPNRLREIYANLESTSGALQDGTGQWQANAEGVEAWNQAVAGAFKQTEEYSQAVIDNSQALLDQAAVTDKSAGSWKKVADGVYEQRDAFANVNDVLAEYRDQLANGLITQEQFDAIEKYASTLKGGSETAAKSMDTATEAVKKTDTALGGAADKAEEFALKWEELASNERLKTLELGAEIQVAEIDAQVRQVEAVFDSLNTTITSTGDTLTGLYAALDSDNLSMSQEWALERVLKEENERRAEAVRLQNELTQAQIDQLRAKTNALRSGDGLIRISSDGLEPALETVMWQIIEKVQLRANAEGAEFLLGL
ncbi:phage tail tape measure protein [Modicisalibacter luteus]|uniref:Phage tail tape measure protein n=1 Tax=Modicisalibacter luteus TaxID=453962 RepID=A0ABV7M2Z9_9GAMM|nr:phage tail tape measure protein [Halomonas lutea]GHA85454.1 hypothetical protein GCM10007159_03210 [Halomonas lutea]